MPRPDSYCPDRKQVVKAYILEAKLRRILQVIMDVGSYKEIQEKTGLSLLDIEEAVEDRVYSLDRHQLQRGLEIYGEGGVERTMALVMFMAKPVVALEDGSEDGSEDVEEADLAAELASNYDFMDEHGYPVEALAAFCQVETELNH